MLRIFFLSFLCLSVSQLSWSQAWQISAPAGSEYAKVDKNGVSVLPNGRLITPLGKQIMTAPHPYGLVLSKDGNIAVTANSGTNPFSVSIFKNVRSANPTVLQVPEGF